MYSRDNLPSLQKNMGYVMNFANYTKTGAHWVIFHSNKNSLFYSDSFGIMYIHK